MILQSENPAGFSRQKSGAHGLLDILELYCMGYRKRMDTRDHMEDQIGFSKFFPRGKTDRKIQLILGDRITLMAYI